MICKQNEYSSHDGTRCCARCPAGKFVNKDCDSTGVTECLDCGQELYTATMNNLAQCILCTKCNTNQKVVKECQAHENRQCECNQGFYCHDPSCEQCLRVTSCPPGEGVKVQATATNDTICLPCESGMFSNVSDHTSPCKKHTSCEEQGRMLTISGTYSADAVCGSFKSGCSWELPAGLWSGLVLTSLLVFLGLIFWRIKRKSRKTVVSRVPADPVASVGLPVAHLSPPGPSPLMDIQCQESCDRPSHITVDCNCCVLDHVVENDLHKTQPESTSFPNPFNYEDNLTNGRPDDFIETSHAIRSEPQEDEWRGT